MSDDSNELCALCGQEAEQYVRLGHLGLLCPTCIENAYRAIEPFLELLPLRPAAARVIQFPGQSQRLNLNNPASEMG